MRKVYEPRTFIMEVIKGERDFSEIDMPNARLNDVVPRSLYEDFNRILRKSRERLILNSAYLRGLMAPGMYLSRAILTTTDLSGAQLDGADLTEANISWTDLSHANLSGANLIGADVSGTGFFKTDLSYADISNIKNVGKAKHISTAHFSKTKADEETRKIIEREMIKDLRKRWAEE